MCEQLAYDRLVWLMGDWDAVAALLLRLTNGTQRYQCEWLTYDRL